MEHWAKTSLGQLRPGAPKVHHFTLPHRSKCSARFTNYILTNGHYIIIIGHYILTNGHYILTNRHYILTNGHCILTNGHCILTRSYLCSMFTCHANRHCNWTMDSWCALHLQSGAFMMP